MPLLESVVDQNDIPILVPTWDTSISSTSIISNERTSWIPRLAYLIVCHFQPYLQPSFLDCNKNDISSSSSSTSNNNLTNTRATLDSATISLETLTSPSSLVSTNNSFAFSTAMAVVNMTQQYVKQEIPLDDIDLVTVLQTDRSKRQDNDNDNDNDESMDRYFPTTTSPSQAMWNLTLDLQAIEEDNSILKNDTRIIDDAILTEQVPTIETFPNLTVTSSETDLESTTAVSSNEETIDTMSNNSTIVSPTLSEASIRDDNINNYEQETAEMLTTNSAEETVTSIMSLTTLQSTIAASLDKQMENVLQTTTLSSNTPFSTNSQSSSTVLDNTAAIIMDQSEADHDALRRRRAAEISHSFFAKKFRPAWFAKNPHLQTIAAVKARQESMYFLSNSAFLPKISQFQWDHRQRVETPDGDFFDVDYKYTSKPIDNDQTSPIISPVVLICHGLQSNTDSPLTKDMAIAFNNVGMDVAAINFRGCSGELNRTPMGYHLSFTSDLEFMVQQISQTQPGRPIYLSGFSLGANVVTKFLADLGVQAANKYNICGAAVNAVPFDLTKTHAINEPGFSGAVYGDLLVKSLKNRVLESMKTIDYNFTKDELENCKNCKEFDDLVVCSVYEDFDNAEDYHRKSSTADRISEIMVPHFILQALDDPFFVGNTNPENNPELPCRIEYTEHGGHCGYVFHTEELDRRESSFMPTELARFLEHVDLVRRGKKSTTVAWRQPTSFMAAPEDVKVPKKFNSYRERLRRKQAAIAAHTFDARDFVPVEWAKNEHFQTIMGALFRRETMYVKNATTTSLFASFLAEYKFQWDKRQRMTTPDGDFFDVDWKYTNLTIIPGSSDPSQGNPVVLICHGLQSDSSSPLAQDMAQAFNDIGMDAACINFRGCSGEINKTPVGYHLGFTEDLKQMIDFVRMNYPRRRIYLSGFSLGANVVTTCLAELGESAYDYNIFGAAVNAVPFDMPKAQMNLNQDGITKSLYGSRLLASMVDRVETAYDRVAFPFPKEEARKCRSIMDMENLVIAPIFGFKDAYDYYEKTSTLPKINQIAVPQLVIQAKGDPFFVGQALPKEDASRPLRVHQTEYGGHCGYVFHSQEEESYKTSWMPTELARFLAHLEDTFSSQVDQFDDYQ